MIDTTANIIICRLTLGVPKKQTMEVTNAPAPKKKMKNPGVTSSKRKQTKLKKNQKTSGFEKIFVLIAIIFKLSKDTKIILINNRV
jgi:hypothetical protein